MNTLYHQRRHSSATWLAPFLSLLGAGSLLGLSTNLAKLSADAGMNPATLLSWSIWGATAILTLVQGIRSRLPKISIRILEYAVISSLVGVVGPNLILFSAVPEVGVSFVTLSMAFPPLFTYLGALILGMERFQFSRAIGVVFALGGAVLLAAFKLIAPNTHILWIIATMIVPIVLAIGNIYRTHRWPPGANSDELAPAMLIASSIMLLVTGTVSDLPLSVPLNQPILLLLIGAQAIAFSLQYLLFFILQKRGGPVYLSLLGSVASVVGIPIAVLGLGESLPDGLIIAAPMIALGVYLVARGGNASKAKDHSSASVTNTEIKQSVKTRKPVTIPVIVNSRKEI